MKNDDEGRITRQRWIRAMKTRQACRQADRQADRLSRKFYGEKQTAAGRVIDEAAIVMLNVRTERRAIRFRKQ